MQIDLFKKIYMEDMSGSTEKFNGTIDDFQRLSAALHCGVPQDYSAANSPYEVIPLLGKHPNEIVDFFANKGISFDNDGAPTRNFQRTVERTRKILRLPMVLPQA